MPRHIVTYSNSCSGVYDLLQLTAYCLAWAVADAPWIFLQSLCFAVPFYFLCGYEHVFSPFALFCAFSFLFNLWSCKLWFSIAFRLQVIGLTVIFFCFYQNYSILVRLFWSILSWSRIFASSKPSHQLYYGNPPRSVRRLFTQPYAYPRILEVLILVRQKEIR